MNGNGKVSVAPQLTIVKAGRICERGRHVRLDHDQSRAHVKLTLCAIEPDLGSALYSPFSMGVKQLHAAILGDPRVAHWDVQRIESPSMSVDEWHTWALASDADVLGFSTFVWSMPTFVEVAERLRQVRPELRLVLGGPCARPVMFELPRYAGKQQLFDAVVIGEGEWALAELLAQTTWQTETLAQIPNVMVATQSGWQGGLPLPNRPMDAIPSAILADLAPWHRTVTMERFRGCPMSCQFCSWGDLTTPYRVFSEERLTAEFARLKEHGTRSVQLVDAGLNLNTHAFRNLVNADRAVDFLGDVTFYTCAYPSIIQREHVEFLERCERVVLEVGVQSLTPAALKAMERPFRMDRFDSVIAQLMRVAELDLEMILGLPGDNPESFKAGVERVLRFGCRLRVYVCLILPDALMSRGKPEHHIRYNQDTLFIESCLGWTEKDIAETRAWLDEQTEKLGGERMTHTWTFHPRAHVHTRASIQLRPLLATYEDTQALEPRLAEISGGKWALKSLGRTDSGLRAKVEVGKTDLQLDFIPAHRGTQHFQVVDDVAVSWRSGDGDPLEPMTLAMLNRVVAPLTTELAPRLRALNLPHVLPDILPMAAEGAPMQSGSQRGVARLKTPTAAEISTYWRRTGAMVVQEALPAEKCAATIQALDNLVEHLTTTQPVQAKPNMGDMLRASTRENIAFVDPGIATQLPLHQRVARVGHLLHQLPEIQALLREPAIVHALQTVLIDPRIVSVAALMRVGEREPTPMQDAWFYRTTPPTALAVLHIALADLGVEQSCAYLVPRSHREGPVRSAPLGRDNWQFSEATAPAPDLEVGEKVEMTAGSFLLHQGSTWHWQGVGKPIGENARPRYELLVHVVSGEAGWVEDNWIARPDGGFLPLG